MAINRSLKLNSTWNMGLILATFWAAGAESPLPTSPVALKPVPFHRIKRDQGKERIVSGDALKLEVKESQETGIAFYAVDVHDWPEGLVPIFAIEKADRFELRRRPATGQENISDALFFALPPEDEPEAPFLAGRWQCVGMHADGGKDFFGWDLTIDSGRVAGRFDPETDYRFASIMGGTFRSNRLEMQIEYINSKYSIVGTLQARMFSGSWTKLGEDIQGSWTASRKTVKPVIEEDGLKPVALYEWSSEDGQSRRYAADAPREQPGWRRAERPLGLVWVPR